MKFLFKILLLFLFLSLYQKPEFFFIPLSNNTFWGFVGLVFFFLDRKTKRLIKNQVHPSCFRFIKYSFPVAVIALCSLIINESRDIFYLKLPITLIFAFFANYLIVWFSYKVYKDFTLKIFFKYLLLAHIIYLGISLLIYITPELGSFFLNLLKLDENAELTTEKMQMLRIVGFGASFFGAGLLNGFILILLAAYITLYEKTTSHFLLYFCIVFLGLAMARTTLIGAGIGLFFLFISAFQDLKAILQYFRKMFTALSVLCVSAFLVIRWVDFDLEVLFNFAFEIFINYAETGEASSASTDIMWNMYDTIPASFKTWIIGDALWTDPDGLGYYMHVDIGYLRALWYFGVIGTISLFLYYFYTLKLVFVRKQLFGSYSCILFWCLFVYTLIINLKGPCDLGYYIVGLYFCTPVSVSSKTVCKC